MTKKAAAARHAAMLAWLLDRNRRPLYEGGRHA